MTLELGGFDPQATYSAAAEDYERASQRFWQFLSTRTVERLALQPGQSVIDAACGTAPGTIAAARAMAPGGRVVARITRAPERRERRSLLRPPGLG